MFALPIDEVHVWWAEVDEAFAPALELMGPEERLQHQRFVFAKDRWRYLVSRALVRTVLSQYLPLRPDAWAFSRTVFGRPKLLNPEARAAALDFNLSHTDDLVVLALSCRRRVGVDIEDTRRCAPLEVARTFFSREEAQAMASLAPEEQPWRFWELWTFKESYIKARGQGLSLPLDRFSVLLPCEGEVGLDIDASLNDDPAYWQLWQLRPDPNHLLAVCVQSQNGTTVRWTCRQLAGLARVVAHPTRVTRSPVGIPAAL